MKMLKSISAATQNVVVGSAKPAICSIVTPLCIAGTAERLQRLQEAPQRERAANRRPTDQ